MDEPTRVGPVSQHLYPRTAVNTNPDERLMSKLKAAVIGTGFIGPVHVEGLARAGVSVTGILGSSPEKSQAAADRLGLPQGYASLDELLADDDVDVVHITSPNQAHFEQACRSLDAGKHVLCEKPLATNSRQSAELVNLAKRKRLAAGVNYNIRYYPLCLEAADRVRRGDVGTVFHVTGNYAQDWLFHPTDFNWRVSAEQGGELRAVADIGTHWLDLVQYIAKDNVTSVCADLQTVFQQRQQRIGSTETFSTASTSSAEYHSIDVTTEDFGAILLRFESGSRGVVWVSQVTAGRKNCLRFEIAGSNSAVAWCSEQPNDLWIGNRDEANQSLIRDPSLLSSLARQSSSYPGGHNEGFPDTFKQLFRDYYGSIERGDFFDSPSYPSFADGHREIVLCEAILESHRQQRWIHVENKE